jgi:hypothetical protein
MNRSSSQFFGSVITNQSLVTKYMLQQVPICENGARVSDLQSGEAASTSLSLNVARDGSSDWPALDLNCTEEDDRRGEFSLPVPGSGTATGPLHPASSHSHGHGLHCSMLELELGMSLSTPSIGT